MSKILRTSADGRKCIYPQCKCTLSIYNHGVYCHIHQAQMPQEQKPKSSIPKRITSNLS